MSGYPNETMSLLFDVLVLKLYFRWICNDSSLNFLDTLKTQLRSKFIAAVLEKNLMTFNILQLAVGTSSSQSLLALGKSYLRVVQGYSHDTWLADFIFRECEFRKFLFVIRDLKVLRDLWKTLVINRYLWFYHSVQGSKLTTNWSHMWLDFWLCA